MTSTLEAPSTMGSRSHASEMLFGLPSDMTGQSLKVVFSEGALGTPSFVDELVRLVLVDRNAALLSLENANERHKRIARESAAHFGVVDRLHCQ